jgi:hypothetical protein
MFMKLTLGAAAVAAVAFLTPVSAAPFTPQTGVAEGALVEQVHWWGRRHCEYWRHECASRWGWGTPRFYRCLWRHNCG